MRRRESDSRWVHHFRFAEEVASALRASALVFAKKSQGVLKSTASIPPLDIGNPIVILGYPVYGTQIRQGALSPVEITATEDIISGQDSGYYTTSAKIDHGNSGGLAIDKDNNCYFGIPTWDLSGGFESLGRILPASSFLNY